MRRSEQHGEHAAARASDKHRRADAEREQNTDDVAELGHAIVVRVIGVVIGMAAPA